MFGSKNKLQFYILLFVLLVALVSAKPKKAAVKAEEDPEEKSTAITEPEQEDAGDGTNKQVNHVKKPKGRLRKDKGAAGDSVKQNLPYKYADPIDAARTLFSNDTADVEVRAHAAWELARRSLDELRKIEDKLKENQEHKPSSGEQEKLDSKGQEDDEKEPDNKLEEEKPDVETLD